ncbi:hypothetical protein ACFL6S_22010 [Candidatus Poribacteria bacterium]
MRKILFGALIGFVVAGLLSVGTILVAQDRRDEVQGPLVVLAGLKLKEGADVADAEKLFKEQLVPGLDGMDGLELRILKRMAMERRGETTDPNAYDYIMMADIEKLQVFMQLRQNPDAGLEGFGDMMKKYAGSPDFNLYTVIAKTKETE